MNSGIVLSDTAIVISDNLATQARRALRANLHALRNSSAMFNILTICANHDRQSIVKNIVLASRSSKMFAIDVGCALLMENGCVMAYVKPAFRRLGIASTIVPKVVEGYPFESKPLFAWQSGNDDSLTNFWSKMNIDIRLPNYQRA